MQPQRQHLFLLYMEALKARQSDFSRLAYTEILDVIQIELKANGESLEEYGMDIEKINNDDYIVEWSLASEMTANSKE